MPTLPANDDIDDVLEHYMDVSIGEHAKTGWCIKCPPFLWKGVEWSFLIQLQENCANVGCFVGYESRNVPDDLSLPVNVEIALMDEKDRTKTQNTRSFSHTFVQQELDPQSSRYDHGYSQCFKSSLFSQRDHFVLRIRMEEAFSPATVPTKTYSSKKETGLVGLENLGATCYLNSLLQMLFHINCFRKTVYSLPYENEVYQSSTTLALQNVFKSLQCSSDEVTTVDLTRAFGWTSQDAFLQQDVQEMMRVLLDKLEDKLKATDYSHSIKDTFAGLVRSYIRCIGVEYESKREEEFYDIQLDVKGCKNVYESLQKYTAKEVLEGENQYDAGDLGKRDAEKGVIFTKLPPVLTIHLKRFDFDLEKMCFAKIHDRFEFPARLEMGDFLAADACPESLASSTYLLHSVLVHAGDVGGGHYYAYIRPSTGCDYASFSDSGAAAAGDDASNSKPDPRGGQWFKFNDEVVLKVSAKEAINHCFGSSGILPNLFAGLSSAYMLVYIRESDAQKIMADEGDGVIPSGLRQRLDEEMSQREKEQRRLARERMFYTVNYATEVQVRRFKSYSRENDFVSLKDTLISKVMVDSRGLRYLLNISDELKVSPSKIRLWACDFRGKWGLLRVDHCLKLDQLRLPYSNRNDTIFYAEVLPDDGSEIESTTIEQFVELRRAEADWLHELQLELSKLPFNGDSADLELCAGCGIGSSNKALLQLRRFDQEAGIRMTERIEILEAEMTGLLERSLSIPSENESLVFFKAFDPDASLSAALGKGNNIHDEVSLSSNNPNSLSSHSNTVEEAPPGTDIQQRDHADRLSNPYRLLGSRLLKRDISTSELFAACSDVLEKYCQSQPGGTVPREWIDHSLRTFFSAFCRPTFILHEETESADDIPFFYEGIDSGDIVVLEVLPQYRRPTPFPFGVTTSEEWIRYTTFKKRCVISPMTDTDARMVGKYYAACVEGDNSSLDSAREKRRKLSAPLTSQLNAADHSFAGANDMSPAHFTTEMSTGLRLGICFDHICSRIGQSRNQVALFVASTPNVDPKALLPMVCVEPDISLMKTLAATMKRLRVTSSLYIWYRILPFPIISDEGIDQRGDFRFAEILITNHEIRAARRRAAAVHQLQTANAISSDSGNGQLAFTGDRRKRKLPRSSDVPSVVGGEGDADIVADEHDLEHGHEASFEALCESRISFGDDLNAPERLHLVMRRELSISEFVGKIRSLLGERASISEIQHTVDEGGGISTLEKTASSSWLSQRAGSIRSLLSENMSVDDMISRGNVAILLRLRDFVVTDIMLAEFDVYNLPAFWCEANYTPNLLFHVAVQFIPTKDLMWFTGGADEIQSIPVSVFNFTLLGSCVKPCEPDLFGGPFLSYIREDDSFESLTARLSAVTGETDWSSLRIAIVVDKVPFFVARNSAPSSRVQSNEGNDLDVPPMKEEDGSSDRRANPVQKSIWELFLEKYGGHFVLNNMFDADKACNIFKRGKESFRFPTVGIQRSNVETEKNRSPRNSSSIKIHG